MTVVTGLRPVTADDAQAVLALVHACDIADIGEPDYTMEDVEDDLRRATWQGWGIDDGAGGLLALYWMERLAHRPDVGGDVVVHPGEDAALGDELLRQLRVRAGQRWPELPLHIFTVQNSKRDRSWLDAAGGRAIRHFWRMLITLGETPPTIPAMPPGVSLEQPADERAQLETIHQVMETAFVDHFGSSRSDYDDWIERQRSGSGADLGLWWLARVDGRPAATLVGRAWPETGWVQGLGTLRAFRGRGLGRMLLLTSFAEFHRRGYRSVSLSVDATNPTGAVALYESAGMTVRYEAVLYELDPLPAGSVAE